MTLNAYVLDDGEPTPPPVPYITAEAVSEPPRGPRRIVSTSIGPLALAVFVTPAFIVAFVGLVWLDAVLNDSKDAENILRLLRFIGNGFRV